MTVLTLQPDGTTTNGDSTVTGAATRHAALIDASTSSYVSLTGPTFMVLAIGAPTFPSGSLFKRAAIAVQVNTTAYPAPMNWGITLTGGEGKTTIGAQQTYLVAYSLTLAPALTQATNPTDSAIYVSRGSGSGTIKLYELSVLMTYVAKPTLSVSTPTGTLTTTNVPEVAWAGTYDVDSDSGRSWEAKIFNSTQYGAGGFDPSTSTPYDSTSGSVTGTSPDTTWTPTVSQANATYRAYVRVGSQCNGVTVWSDWTYSGYIINATPPADPTFTLTPSNSNGRVAIALTSGGGTPSTAAFQVQRSLDGTTFEDIRNVNDTYPTSGTVYDYEMPQDATVTYRVRAMSYLGAITIYSAWVTHTTSWGDGEWWLKHPTDPTLNRAVTLRSNPTVQRAARQSSMQALGASKAVVVSDTRGADTGTVVFQALSDTARDDFAALFDAGVPLLVQAPSTDHWRDRWVSIGDTDSTRIVDAAWAAQSDETQSWTETDRPSGGLE